MKQTTENYYKNWLLKESDYLERVIERDLTRLSNLVPQKTNIHIIGICGKGTATLAGLLKEKGFNVSGSDNVFYPPMSDVVENLHITIYREYDEGNIKNADIVIVANMHPPSHTEILAAKKQGILQLSMSEALEYLIVNNTKNIVIAGTHGKTTLTGMITWMLEKNNISPTSFIGGVIQGEQKSYYSGTSEYSVLEGDEYDTAYFDKGPKFLHYKPWCTVITSCEYDHVTMYSSFQEYIQAFKFLIQETNPEGYIIIHESIYKLFEQELAEFPGTCIMYGTTEESDYVIHNYRNNEQNFNAIIKNKQEDIVINTPHSGIYNMENTVVGYIIGSRCCNLEKNKVLASLYSFPGMERRQEVLLENENIILIDDFAHHPTAVRVTLEGIKQKYPTKRIICLFEPRSSSSRKKIFEEPYSKSFTSADIIVICSPELRENDSKDDFVDVNHITRLLKNQGKVAEYFSKPIDIIPWLEKVLQKDDLVVTMSNASFDNIQEKIIELLK